MNLTYNEILEKMRGGYFDACGERLKENSESEKRLEAVASELYALSCYGDYIFKQAFVQTATGEELDKHAQLRGVKRKSADFSHGEVTFSVLTPADENISIPKGTICSVKNKPYLQFATDEQCVINAGELNATVAVTALSSGGEHNVKPYEISVMVNAPTSVYSVFNSDYLQGGCDTESDASLRRRIINHYAMPANGVNCCSVANALLDYDFVRDCNVFLTQEKGVITVVIKSKTGKLEAEEINKILDSVGLAELVGASVEIVESKSEDFAITVEANARVGFDKAKTEQEIKKAVKEICSALKIGEPLFLSDVTRKLMSVNGIGSFNVYSDKALGGVVNCSADGCLCLTDLVVNFFDE